MRAPGIFSAFSLLIALTVTAVPRTAVAAGASRHATAIDVRATDRGRISSSSHRLYGGAHLQRAAGEERPAADHRCSRRRSQGRAGCDRAAGGPGRWRDGPGLQLRFAEHRALLGDAARGREILGDGRGQTPLDHARSGQAGHPRSTGGKTRAGAHARGQKSSSVRDVRFDHGRLEDKIVVELSETARYRHSNPSSTRSVLVIEDAALPEGLARTLDVAAFGGLVRSVSSYANEGRQARGLDRRRALERGDERGHAQRDELVWSFFRPGSLPSSTTGVGTRRRGCASSAHGPRRGGAQRHPGDPRRLRECDAGAGRAHRGSGPGCGVHAGSARRSRHVTPAGASISTSRTPTSTTCCACSPTSAASTSSPPTTCRAPSRSACATCPGIRRSTSCSRPRASAWCGRAT